MPSRQTLLQLPAVAGVHGERLDPLQHCPRRSVLGRDAEAVREVVARRRPVAAPVCAQGELVSCPQLLSLSGNLADPPDDLEDGVRRIDAREEHRIDFTQLEVRADGLGRPAADEVRGTIYPLEEDVLSSFRP